MGAYAGLRLLVQGLPVSQLAKAFMRRRYWLDGLDGGRHRNFSPFEQHIADALRTEAAYLIGFMAS